MKPSSIFHKAFVFRVNHSDLVPNEVTPAGAVPVTPEDWYSEPTGYGFVTAKQLEEDEALRIPETGSGFLPGGNSDFCGEVLAARSASGYSGCRAAAPEVPLYFRVCVPRSGNYHVTLTLCGLGQEKRISVFVERRRCVLWNAAVVEGTLLPVSFTANVCGIIPRGQKMEQEDRWLDFTLAGDGAFLVSVEITEAPDTHTVFLAGDSTVTDQPADIPYSPEKSYCGWGQMLPAFLRKGIAVSNHAHSGLTTEAFFAEGHWTIVNREMKPGDYLFVQFGHNDQKQRTLSAYGGYAENLRKFVREAQKKGVHILLISPVSRALWNAPGGTFNDLLARRAQACRAVAREMGVPFLDLHEWSMEFFLGQGRKEAARWFHPGDRTHFNDFGAYVMAFLVARELGSCGFAELAEHLRDLPRNLEEALKQSGGLAVPLMQEKTDGGEVNETGDYFDKSLSARAAFGDDIESILQAVSNRYIAENPAQPYVFRLSSRAGIRQDAEYQYRFGFDSIFPGTGLGKVVCAWAKFWSDTDRTESFRAAPDSPMEIYVNEERVFRSNYYEEKTQTLGSPVRACLKQGWNSIVLMFWKTDLGFGGSFGTPFFKNKPWYFLAPTPERDGQEGFVYTEPCDQIPTLPRLNQHEQETGLTWFPVCIWNETERRSGCLKRIFGLHPRRFAYGWTRVFFQDNTSVLLEGENTGEMTVLIDGTKAFHTSRRGIFSTELSSGAGWKDVVVESRCTQGDDWGFCLTFLQNGEKCRTASPCMLRGTNDPWIYCGTFGERRDTSDLARMSQVFHTSDGEDAWRADLPQMAVRPFLETPNYANWNYPVGVTLYGLMKTGELLNRADYRDYAAHHIEACTEYYEYALWDKKTFGAPGVDAQIAAVDSLDDCGSFASSMLEMAQERDLPGFREIARDTAKYIEHRQARLPDGALYRFRSSLEEMKNTMWLDDLYMSVPFLARYYRLTGDASCLDDAAEQFLLYRKKMFLPDLKVMSHVYYTDRKLANKIPWGRGNGWVLFSLTELLLILPESHRRRETLLDFFRTLCEGYLALQDPRGMWHQVLNDPESYRETSCSSMFVCAFARGVRHGWFRDPAPYRAAAVKGWEGLTRNAVDRGGNLYGICRGSGHSFTPRYYKEDLNWILNDTHGIGVFLLAGVEVQKMLNQDRDN